MALGFKRSEQSRPQTSAVDQILVAETKWGWSNVGRKNPLIALATAAKGDIAIRIGSNWIDRGDLTDIDGITTVAAVAVHATAFQGNANNDITIFSAAVASGLSNYRVGATTVDSAAKGEIAQFDGTNWQRRGNLTNLTGITTLGTIRAGASFSGTGANDIFIFSGAGTSLTNYYRNGLTFIPGIAVAGISDEVKSADETGATDDDSVDIFYKHQPRIVEGGLREDGSLVDIPIKTGNAGMNKYASGPLDITDGFMVTGSCDGSALIYRMITQMKDPGAGDALNGTSSTEHTIVASAAVSSSMTVVDIADAIKNPVKVKITPHADAELVSGKASTTIKITGTVIDGLDSKGENYVSLTETVTLKRDEVAAGTAKETSSYFKTVSAVSGTSADWGTGTNEDFITVTCQDNAKQVKFIPQDDELVAFWDVEYTKGTIPNLYRRVIANEISISVSRTEAIIFALTLLGKDALTYTNFVGNKWNPDITEGNYPKKTSATNLESASDQTYTGWQVELNVGGIDFPLLDSTLTINQNLVNSDVISGSRFQSSPPVRNGNRDTSLSGTVIFSPENNLSNAFRNNLTWEDVSLILRNAPLAGFPWQTEIKFNKAQLRVSPDPASPRNERINQTFELMAFTEDISGDLEYEIIANYADYVQPRVYS